ncbi:MAG: hypothetical protein N2Z79_01505, partial [Candidatus Omnitrophica bacterium]|nr:hypothetical protein [Candidatus Omnitrophota bacterium]
MLTIAWDVDDVLNELMRFWFRKWLKSHPELNLKYTDLIENPPHRLLGISEEKYLTSLDAFRLSEEYKKMSPNPEVKRWFLKNGKIFRHIAVSGVPVACAYITAEWVFRNFGKWIRTFHFVPSYRQKQSYPIYDRNKNDFLCWFGKVDIFVDDNEANLDNLKDIKIKKILFPQPWNRSNLTIKQALQMIR